MRKTFFSLSLFILTLFTYASTESAQEALLKGYRHVFDLGDYTGQTYLSFMKSVVKPAIDEVVENGYQLLPPEEMESAYESLSPKVQGSLERAGGLEAALKVAKKLEGEDITAADLPSKIAEIVSNVDRYDMANILGLLSGGGVVIRYHDNNYAYNVHYDKTEQRSGRSYGVGPTRLALDASDKEYLTDVQKYFSDKELRTDLSDFYRAILLALLDSDPLGYAEVAPFGQTVLSDFLAVYTAEQARNLMDNRVSIHWDAALLEVTLLASYHAGQEKFKLYYQNPETKEVSFTDRVLKQEPCRVPTKVKTASMVDYWQFSRQIDDPKNCRRSGINVTKREFRLLEKKITEYMADHHPALVARLKKGMGKRGPMNNAYRTLSEFLISSKAADELSDTKVTELSDTWVEFLFKVTQEAKKITKYIEANE